MMRAQLDDIHRRGEPIAALYASEETIYGRYGYGSRPCVRRSGCRAPAALRADAPPSSGAVRFVEKDEATRAFPPYERVRGRRPASSHGRVTGGAPSAGGRPTDDLPAAVPIATHSSSSTGARPHMRSPAVQREENGQWRRRSRPRGAGADVTGTRDLAVPVRDRLGRRDPAWHLRWITRSCTWSRILTASIRRRDRPLGPARGSPRSRRAGTRRRAGDLRGDGHVLPMECGHVDARGRCRAALATPA
jgi:hypothetical protein